MLDLAETAKYPSVFAIVVTYGDRFDSVRQVIQDALANGVGKIIVVENGCGATTKKALHNLAAAARGGGVVIVGLPENRGSAGGFKAGMECALSCADCEHVWLLDDDNRPAQGALTQLVVQFERLRESVAVERLALLSLRQDWAEHRKLAHGLGVTKVFPRKSSFMGFHVLTPPGFWSRTFGVKSVGGEMTSLPSAIEIPFGPYGGLFAHTSALAKLGYPDERFFLYNDDVEYTSRFVTMGGRLFLVPASVIYDLEPTWHTLKEGETLFSHYLYADSDARLYFAMRNQSYLETYCFRKNAVVYRLNKLAFFICLTVTAGYFCKWRRFVLIVRAVRDGRLGKLSDPTRILASQDLARKLD